MLLQGKQTFKQVEDSEVQAQSFSRSTFQSIVKVFGNWWVNGHGPKIKVFSGNSDFGFTAQAMVDEPFKPVSGIKVASWPVVLLPGMAGFQEQIEATL